jgi:hypothetical protein
MSVLSGRATALTFFGIKIPLHYILKKKFTARSNRTSGSQSKEEVRKGTLG